MVRSESKRSPPLPPFPDLTPRKMSNWKRCLEAIECILNNASDWLMRQLGHSSIPGLYGWVNRGEKDINLNSREWHKLAMPKIKPRSIFTRSTVRHASLESCILRRFSRNPAAFLVRSTYGKTVIIVRCRTSGQFSENNIYCGCDQSTLWWKITTSAAPGGRSGR